MYRITILVLALVVVSATDVDDVMKERCNKLGNYEYLHCCKFEIPAQNKTNQTKSPKVNHADLKECMNLQENCERDICVGKVFGYTRADGTIDKVALEKHLEDELSPVPGFTKAIADNCINGDLEKYGSSEDCFFAKLEQCTLKQIVVVLQTCQVWDNTGRCAGMEDLVKQCPPGSLQ